MLCGQVEDEGADDGYWGGADKQALDLEESAAMQLTRRLHTGELNFEQYSAAVCDSLNIQESDSIQALRKQFHENAISDEQFRIQYGEIYLPKQEEDEETKLDFNSLSPLDR